MKLLAWAVLFSLLLGTAVEAQFSAKARPSTTRKSRSVARSIALEEEARKYQALLTDVDIKSDPDLACSLREMGGSVWSSCRHSLVCALPSNRAPKESRI